MGANSQDMMTQQAAQRGQAAGHVGSIYGTPVQQNPTMAPKANPVKPVPPGGGIGVQGNYGYTPGGFQIPKANPVKVTKNPY